MKKLIALLTLVFFVSLQAEDSFAGESLAGEEFREAYNSQSEVCKLITSYGIAAHCILNLEPFYFYSCPRYSSISSGPKSAAQTLTDRLQRACPEPNMKNFEQMSLSEQKALLEPQARCIQPLLPRYVKRYKCRAFDYEQALKIPDLHLYMKKKRK